MTLQRIVVGPADAGSRIDRILAERIEDLSRARAQRLLEEGAVRIDGRPAGKASETLSEGTVVEVEIRPRPSTHAVEPEPIPLSVIYEDDDLAVIDKPAGMVVHPAPGHGTGTLVHALLHRYGDRLASVTDSSRPGIVHRLDRGTSGVILVALTDRAHTRLAAQFADRSVDKTYEALVYGTPDADHGTIAAPIGRDPKDRKRMSTRARRGRDALTDWRVLEPFPGLALLEARPRTGRTHQIRVHLAHIGHAIVGDDDYAGRQWKGVPEGRIRSLLRDFPRPALHARRLEFEHPRRAERMAFEAPLPADLSTLLDRLRAWRDGV